ncbi:tetronasin ABC transporter permease domain protein [Mycobacterium xenopi 4042]|uniref:Tetronasin ABC transporter permease domain protein n=1 Tax=Mycobacterium xenopi 4042 TaxID=1299334 RepID=X8DZE8_MYCXE|nr:tetronasin ABC transporter permease domain protein [Mycobacterium xenopi 4042]
MVLAGIAAGLSYGTAAGDVGGKLSTVVGTAAVQLPAVWLLAAVTAALFGLMPRLASVAWVCSSGSSRCTCLARCRVLRNGFWI